MAQVHRKVSVANPTRRTAKRKTSSKRKPMSAAARKAFGERMAQYRGKGKTTMAAKRKSNPTRKAKRRASNPTGRRSRRNGTTSTAVSTTKNLVIEGTTALVAMVGTRQIPQALLAEKNTGMIGYLANALTAGAGWFIASKLVSRRAGNAAAIGGVLYLVDRVLTEKVSPIGQFLSLAGLGDATAASSLGTISDAYFVSPTVVDAMGNPVIPRQIGEAGANAYAARTPAPAAPGLGRIPSRFARTN